MKSVVETLKTGNAKERIAIVADIVSIFGVSLATVVGGVFALTGKFNVGNIIGVSIGALFSLAGASLVILAFLVLSSLIRNRTSNNPTAYKLLQLSLWAAFSGLFLFSAYLSYEIISSIRFVHSQ